MEQNNQIQSNQPQDAIASQIKSDKTKEKFVNLFMGIHKCNKEQAEQIFQNESFSFLKIREENPDLLDCTLLSTMGCFLEAVNSGLSFSKAKGHIYLQYRNVTVTKGDQSCKEKRMVWDESPDGEVYLRQRVGSIQYVTTPVIVYDCDDYKLTAGDKPSIFHAPKYPRPKGATVVLGYNYVVDAKGEKHLFWIDHDGIERLKYFSAKSNGYWKKENGKAINVPGKPNDLYTSFNGGIDPGFFKAKIKKFSVKDFRKDDLPSSIMEYKEMVETPADRQLPEPNQNAEYATTMIVTPTSDVTSTIAAPPNEFSPDAINDLPVIDSPSPDQLIDEEKPVLFDNNF